MNKRTIAIGDIHGCSQALNVLLDTIAPQSSDTIITLGDYVDRGPHSREVVDRLLQLQKQCELVPLLGNHELMLLTAMKDATYVDFWLNCGGNATIDSYGGAFGDIPESHLAFFAACALAYETDSHIFVHANYDPQRPLDEQDDETLLWKHLSIFGIPEPHISGKLAVVGHTPQETGDILDVGHLVCIDTWCFGDGFLTAYDVDSRTVWQVSQDGILRTD